MFKRDPRKYAPSRFCLDLHLFGFEYLDLSECQPPFSSQGVFFTVQGSLFFLKRPSPPPSLISLGYK